MSAGQVMPALLVMPFQDLSLVGTAVSPRVALKVLSNNKRRMVLFKVTSLLTGGFKNDLSLGPLA